MRKVVNGVESAPIASAKMPAGFTIYGVQQAIGINAVGNHIICTVDGVTVVDFTDNTFASGSAGLRGWSGTDVGFISAKALDGKATGDGDPSKGDLAYAAGDVTILYGLVGWMSGDGAFVGQPLH